MKSRVFAVVAIALAGLIVFAGKLAWRSERSSHGGFAAPPDGIDLNSDNSSSHRVFFATFDPRDGFRPSGDVISFGVATDTFAGACEYNASSQPASERRDDARIELTRRLTTSAGLRTRAPTLLARPDSAEQKELPLEALRISTVLAATRARTLIDCTFANPHERELQGTLLVRLPDGASPCYLGMFQGTGLADSGNIDATTLLPPPLEDPGSLLARRVVLPSTWSSGKATVEWGALRPAEVVEEKQARITYEQVTRRKVDPALMEWAGGNTFSTRIFPIPARGRKRVFFVYDQPAADLGGRVLLPLPVPEKPPASFRLEVAASARAFEDAVLAGARGDTALALNGDFLRASLSGEECRTEGSYLLTAKPRDSRIRAGFAASAALPGKIVHARLAPRVEKTESRPTGSAVFVLDTSLSQRTKLAASCGRLLREILERDESIERFRVVTFDVTARPLFEGWRKNDATERARTFAEVEQLWLEGATNLQAALTLIDRTTSPGEHPTFFLLSDAQITWGLDEPRELERAFARIFAERWICYQIGDSATSRPIVERLARSGGRVVSVVSGQEVGEAAIAHRSAPLALGSVRVEGLSVNDLVVAGKPRVLFPGQIMDVAFRTPEGVDPRDAVVVVETEKGRERFSLDGASDGDIVSARAWAELAASELLELGDAEADRVALALSQEFALANRVASFLILETDQEYAAHAIEREKLDLARLAASAARNEASRPVGEPDVSSLDSRALAFLEKVSPTRTEPWARQRPRRASDGVFTRPTWGERLEPLAVWREAERRADAARDEEALRILSSIVEDAPRDAPSLRLTGFTLLSRGRFEEAEALFARVRRLRPFEPQAWLCEALALEGQGLAGLAALRYEVVLAGKFDPRHEVHAKNAVSRLYARLLSKLGAAGEGRIRELGLTSIVPVPPHEVYLLWNLDDTDVDMHVRESGGKEIFYRDRTSASGGKLHWDDTTGLGPEIYTHPSSEPAEVFVDYFGSSSVEGAAPAATLVVYFKGGSVVARANVLAERKAKVTLYTAGSESATTAR